MEAKCYDCGLPYSDDGFVDVVIENDKWREISPDGNGNGLLCFNCMCRRASAVNIACIARIASGPFVDLPKKRAGEHGTTDPPLRWPIWIKVGFSVALAAPGICWMSYVILRELSRDADAALVILASAGFAVAAMILFSLMD